MTDPNKRICVIGAGASGLACMKTAQEENLDIVCYERSDFVGGLWKYRDDDDPKLASVTRATIINSSKELSAYSDFIPPKEFPNYMHNSLMHRYFEMYCDNFNLRRYVKFKHEVLRVYQEKDHEITGRWIVKTKNLINDTIQEQTFDAVMVCTGHHVKPLEAKFEGQEKFKGKIIHTHSYKTPNKFENDRCVVVGIGNSGGDAAVELSMFAKKVYLSTRRGAWILWRVGPGGMPFDAMYIRRFWSIMMFTFPYFLVNFVIQAYLNLRFNHKAYGIKPNHYVLSQHPMVNDALPNRILSGTVQIKNDIEKITENGVVFKGENTVTEVDSIILATGYDTHFPFLDKEIIDGSQNEIRLYKYMFNPNLKRPETLCFIGLVQVFGPAVVVSEMQARWHIQLVLGKCPPLPNKKIMNEDINKKRREIEQRYFKGARHTMQVDWVPFMDELASQFGVKPKLTKYFFSDPLLWYKLFFGPCLTYQYRLNGPHSWKGARDAILTYDERVSSALATRKIIKTSSNNSFENLGLLETIFLYIVKFAKNSLHLNNFLTALIIFFTIVVFWFLAK